MNAVPTDSLRSSTCVTAATPCEFVMNTAENEPRSATRTGLCRRGSGASPNPFRPASRP